MKRHGGLYDIEYVIDGRADLFCTPVGINGKTFSETNMYFPNIIKREFLVTGIRCLGKASDAGYLQFMTGCIVVFEIPMIGLDNVHRYKFEIPLVIEKERNFCVLIRDCNLDIVGVELSGVVELPEV